MQSTAAITKGGEAAAVHRDKVRAEGTACTAGGQT